MIARALLFPYPAASPELLERVDAFLAEPGLDPAIGRLVIEGRDVAEGAAVPSAARLVRFVGEPIR